MFNKIKEYSEEFIKIQNDTYKKQCLVNSDTYFLENGDILSIPRDNGDCRYIYNRQGYNFWAYTSGYMHTNDGLFSPFVRATEGQEPKIAFFAGFEKENGGFSVIPLLNVPSFETDDNIMISRYTVFSSAAAYYITELPGIRFAVRAFIDDEKDITFTITAENKSDITQKFFISSYINPFLRHNLFEDFENRYFRDAKVLPGAKTGGLNGFVINVSEQFTKLIAKFNQAVISRNVAVEGDACLVSSEESVSKYQYVGSTTGSLSNPKSLKSGTLKNAKSACAFSEVAVAADMLHFKLESEASIRIDITVEIKKDIKDQSSFAFRKIEPIDIDQKVSEMEIMGDEAHNNLKIKTGCVSDNKFSGYIFERFLKHLMKQVEFCSMLRGYAQLWENSLIGIRDVFQALEGYAFYMPQETRAKILEALSFIDNSGRCPRQYTLPVGINPPKMDLRPFIDQGNWVISTIVTYLRITNDMSFLNEQCGYHQIIDDKTNLVKKSEEVNSVIEHMFRIMNYLISNIDENTHCLHALYGDWNDSLDGLGETDDITKTYGTGVSVMATLGLYKNLNEMIDLLSTLDAGKYQKMINSYKNHANSITTGLEEFAVVTNEKGEKRILHGWGDNYTKHIGGFNDADGNERVSLTSNSFWIISGMIDNDTSMIQHIIRDLLSLDSKYGLRTFSKPFLKDCPGVGRIVHVKPGTLENGANYLHATAFGIMGLFGIGEAALAWNQLLKIVPFTHDYVSTSPYVMPNAYMQNDEFQLDGESILDWGTGSSNVLLKSIIKYVFGIEPTFKGLNVSPSKVIPFDNFEIDIKIHGCNVKIAYTKRGDGERKFSVNGNHKDSILNTLTGAPVISLTNHDLSQSEIMINIYN